MQQRTLLFLAMFAMGFSTIAQTTWDNFEDERKANYSFTSGVFRPYTGNPDKNVNTSEIVGSYVRNAAEMFDVLVLEATTGLENMSAYAAPGAAKQMKIDVWSPAAGTVVQITMEDSSSAQGVGFPTGRHSVYLATTTKAMEWETLTFAFNTRPDPSVPDTEVDRLVLLFAPGTNSMGQYYFDNLVGPEFSPDLCDGVMTSSSTFNDFECNQNANISFVEGDLTRIHNPGKDAMNSSEFVGSYTRDGGKENAVIVGQFVGPLVLGTTNEFSIMVWDPAAPTDVRLALQDASSGTPVDVEGVTVATTTSMAWEKLTFNFGDLSTANVDAFVLLIDPGMMTNETYFLDNFLSGSGATGIDQYLSGGNLAAYPNPTAGLTNFSYELTNGGDISINVYDLAGKEVARVNEGFQTTGSHEVTLDLSSLRNGLYIYQFQVDGQITSGKITLSR
ncbi:MAG: T9SS type A sorting domain-containing protein [Bacteroidota bacterium]